MPYLPNKKFILGLLALLILGGGFLILKNQEKEQKQPTSQELSVLKPVIAEEIDKDSDNDGLKDWEEALWKTDPNNPDTDNDGTLDYTEIKDNRNPLLASKNGKSDKFTDAFPSVKSEAEDSQNEPLSLTEAFGQEFFSEYMRLKRGSNGELSEYDKTELVNSLMSGLNNFQNKTSDYLESDIKIAPTDDEKTIKEYGNNLALFIKKYFDPLPETEMTSLKKSLETENKNGLKNLERIASAYRNTAREMLSLKTPPSFSDSHLNLINYFNSIAKEIDAMQKSYDDPVQALLALKQYQTDSVAAYKILRNLNDYFLNKKVVFENSEPAEFFKVYLE